MTQRTWNEELVAELKELESDPRRLSAGVIAAKLGRGISRCAVIGKLKRLGIHRNPGMTEGIVRLPRKPKQKRRQPTPVSADMPEPEPLGGFGLGLAAGLCQWIHGDPLDPTWRMCGHETGSRGISYCPYHHAVCCPPKPIPEKRAGLP